MRVSVICPTNRNYNIDRLIKIFLEQDYKDKTLLIGLDSLEGVDLSYLGEDSNVFTFYEGKKETIGVKRNRLVKGAKGEIIIHMDDDDWYAPDFITRSVNHLLNTKAAITGLSKAYFYKPHTNMWLYEKNFKQPYVIGSGMCFHKEVWSKKPFPDTNSGEDLEFQANAGKVIAHEYIDGFMAMIHGNNTASHKAVAGMKRINPDIAKSILGESYYLY